VFDEAGFAGLLGVDPGLIAFDLGEGETATFLYPGQAEAYRAACENAASSGVQAAFVFSCNGGFPISVRADITYGSQTIRTEKNVQLLFDDLPANRNPELGAISVFEVGTGAEPAPWGQDAPVQLALGHRYEIRVAVDETSAEQIVPAPTVSDPSPKERHENLFISWFTSSGVPENDRTSYVEGGWSLAQFGTNTWQLPKPGDESHETASMFLVLRDERGGVSWQSREAGLSR
jgi:hypothetical protein